jgi:hypothetical protein
MISVFASEKEVSIATLPHLLGYVYECICNSGTHYPDL